MLSPINRKTLRGAVTAELKDQPFIPLRDQPGGHNALNGELKPPLPA